MTKLPPGGDSTKVVIAFKMGQDFSPGMGGPGFLEHPGRGAGLSVAKFFQKVSKINFFFSLGGFSAFYFSI